MLERQRRDEVTVCCHICCGFNGTGISLHLAAVKGPVMDRLRRTHLLQDLGGRVFLTHFQAIEQLAPEVAHA